MPVNLNDKVWFVDDAGALINWSTAVVSGRATRRIFLVRSTGGVPQTFLWATNGMPVSAAMVVAAQAMTAAGNPPAETVYPHSSGGSVDLSGKADLVSGKVPTSQLPAITFVTTVPVANRAAMLALTSVQVQPGDVAAVAADPGRGSYMLGGDGNPATLANWTLLTSPTDAVVSVNNQTGAVNLAASDVGATTKTYVDAGDAAAKLTPVTTQSGDYTLALADAGTQIDFTNTVAVTVTLPLNSAVPFPIGTRVRVRRIGTNNVTFAATAGVNFNRVATQSALFNTYQSVDFTKVGTDTWTITPGLPHSNDLVDGGTTGRALFQAASPAAARSTALAAGVAVQTVVKTADYPLVATDDGRNGSIVQLEMTATTPTTVTIPLNSAAAYTIGAYTRVVQASTGMVTIAATAGVTIVQPGSSSATVTTSGKDTVLELRKIATDTWRVSPAGGALSNEWAAADHGYKAWSFEPAASSGAQALLNTGAITLIRLHGRKGGTVGAFTVNVTNAGAGLTHVGAVLLDASGLVLASAVDTSGATAAAFQTTGMKTVTWTSPPTPGGDHYVGLWFLGTTAPSVSRGVGTALANAGLTTGWRYAQSTGTYSDTTPPSGTIAFAKLDAAVWAAES